MWRTVVAALFIGVVVGVLGMQCASEQRIRSKVVCEAALLTLGDLEDHLGDQPLSIMDERISGFLRRTQDAADRNCTWLDFPPGASLPTPVAR